MPKPITRTACALATAAAAMTAGCGDLATVGRSPVQVVIVKLEAASGATPDQFGATLQSDVVTLRRTPAPCSATSPCPTVFGDIGLVTMSLVLKDQGTPGVAAAQPTPLHQVTFDRYRVEYRRTDGRNTPGVDVPFPFDSAITVTVPASGTAEAGFQIVRISAKQEAPLRALATSGSIISTIATVTFFGRDQVGNSIKVAGNIGIDFGDFGDP